MARKLRWARMGAGALALSVGLAVTGLGAAARADAGSPTVTGSVTGGNGVPIVFSQTTYDLASVGYQRLEFFLSGTADA